MNDTIVAISTSLGVGAISIVRISGDEAIDIVNKVYKGKNLKKVDSHTIHYGHIVDNGFVIDEVLVSVFRAPKTFTKEDVVEINCHGGVYVTNRILELLVLNGARISEPGEFTKRAYLNGRIDLTQAEAVMDIIESKTKNSLQMANNGILGQTKKVIRDFRNHLLTCIAQIEVNIDYPEYEDEIQVTNEILLPNLKYLLEEFEVILKKSEVSKIIKNGIDTAIIGRPNVGKSSLLNAIIREDKAIVTNIAGTTRDIVEGQINIGGIILNMIDTAGVRVTDDVVEKIGVQKTRQVLEKSDLIILVFDYNSPIDSVDTELLKLTENKNRIIIINKKDLDQKIDLSLFNDYILVSSYDENDISVIENKIKEIYQLNKIETIDPTYIGNVRQITKLKQAKQHLLDAIDSIRQMHPVDIVAIDIQNAWIALGEILGEVSSDDLINEMFSKFCLGK